MHFRLHGVALNQVEQEKDLSGDFQRRSALQDRDTMADSQLQRRYSGSTMNNEGKDVVIQCNIMLHLIDNSSWRCSVFIKNNMFSLSLRFTTFS